MEPIALKRISTKDVMEPRKLTIPPKPEILYSVYGAVTGASIKKSKFKEDNKVLSGRFEALRASDRQLFTGQFLYLPDTTYQDQLAAQCVNLETGEVKEIMFAFKVGYKAATGSPTGYTFTCEPVIDYKAQDALSDVRKLIDFDKVLPRLAAPEADTKKKYEKEVRG